MTNPGHGLRVLRVYLRPMSEARLTRSARSGPFLLDLNRTFYENLHGILPRT